MIRHWRRAALSIPLFGPMGPQLHLSSSEGVAHCRRRSNRVRAALVRNPDNADLLCEDGEGGEWRGQRGRRPTGPRTALFQLLNDSLGLLGRYIHISLPRPTIFFSSSPTTKFILGQQAAVTSAASLNPREAKTMSRTALLSSLSQQQRHPMPMPPNLMPTAAAGRRRPQQPQHPAMAPGTSFTLRLTSSGRCNPQQQQRHWQQQQHHLHHHNPMAATAGSATMLLPAQQLPPAPPPPPPRRITMTTATLPRGIHLGGTRFVISL